MVKTLGLAALVLAVVGCGKKDDKGAPAAGSGAGSAVARPSGSNANGVEGAVGSDEAGSGAGEGSGSADEPTAVEPDTAKPVTVQNAGKAKLAFGGAVDTKLDNVPAVCTCTGDTASVEVDQTRAGAPNLPFKLSVVVASSADWFDPAVMLNVSAPKKGMWGRNAARRKEETVTVAKDCSGATLDVVLAGRAGTKGEISLRGQITCAVPE
jgi:hypothetical protein